MPNIVSDMIALGVILVSAGVTATALHKIVVPWLRRTAGHSPQPQ